MKFKIDENIPLEIADFLNNIGYETHTVYNENLEGCTDNKLFKKCQYETRTLITLDLDFTNIFCYPLSSNPGVIVLRPKEQSKDNILELFKKTLPILENMSLEKRIIIIEDNKVRIREKEK